MPDILFILVLALVIFGPKRLPEIARQLAKFLAQFRMMRDDLRRQIETEVLKIEFEEKEKQRAALAPPKPAPPQLPAAANQASPPDTVPAGGTNSVSAAS